MRKLLLGAAAAAMVFGGGIANAAQSSATGVRSGSVVGDAESLNGSEIGALVVGAAALVFAIIQINDDDDEAASS